MPTELSDEVVRVLGRWMWPLAIVVPADGKLFGVGMDMFLSAT
jgi:hypothetical protein